MKFLGMMLLLTGMAGILAATPVPEVTAGSAGSALAMVAGLLLVVKSRRKN